jgi:hypothetical protein
MTTLDCWDSGGIEKRKARKPLLERMVGRTGFEPVKA